MDDNRGWELLMAGNFSEAAEFFRARLASGEAGFLDLWGLGKYLLIAGQRDEAMAHLETASRMATDDFRNGTLSYQPVELIERDIDAVLGYPRDRLARRLAGYMVGAVRLAGVTAEEELGDMVKRLTGVDTTGLRDNIIASLAGEALVVYRDGLWFRPEIACPEAILERRLQAGIGLNFDLDTVARSRQEDFFAFLEEQMRPVLEELTRGLVPARELVRTFQEADSFSTAYKSIMKRLRVADLAGSMTDLGQFLLDTWVGMPRWDLGFATISSLNLEAERMGDITSQDVARLLGLALDSQGNFICPDCGQILHPGRMYGH